MTFEKNHVILIKQEKIADSQSKERSSQMNKTMYLGVDLNSCKWFEQAVDPNQSLSFCVHIFDKSTSSIVEGI